MQRPAETLAAHHSWLRRVARRMANSPASDDDLVQDTCMTALQNAPEDAEMRPWLRSVMRKLAWGQSRADSRRAQREAISHVYTPPSSDPDPLLAYGVDRQRLARAIEALPEPFRSTIVQRYIEGRSCVEIADDEQVPASTVRTRQQRALELLRSEIEGQAGRRRARRRHLFWWFPLVGSGERIAARLGDGLVALLGQSKAMWLVIVVLAAALGLVSLRDAVQRQHAGGTQPATNPGRPTCDSINRNVAFIDINRRFNFMTHTHANRFLTAAHCRHPEALSCDPFLSEDNLVCVNCRHADGSDRTYCEPAS